ncbi:hypothetical protein B4113_0660 [Geobacillus sp. B4113_201601]|nr:hypothetical protein B4113_0660 [Geobacillus sp. B4113_201601]
MKPIVASHHVSPPLKVVNVRKQGAPNRAVQAKTCRGTITRSFQLLTNRPVVTGLFRRW